MDLSTSTILKYYKRPEIQKIIVDFAYGKEIAIRYKDGNYGKRPDTLQFANDVITLVQQGATSFHCSEELWTNPMYLTTQMHRQELDTLRIGWDLILDIDCPILSYSQIAAQILYNVLIYHGINSTTIKFSGNHGFHIAVPFEAFPSEINSIPTQHLFPQGPRRIAAYLSEMIREPLAQALLEFQQLSTICGILNKKPEDLMTNKEFDPFKVLIIDTVLISSRHLYRMPYSLNEKSGLVSIPINPSQIITFDKTMATPESINLGKEKFLDRTKVAQGEARRLLVNAFDYKLPPDKERIDGIKKAFDTPQEAIPLEHFPPCIMNILGGMQDGKKRALFILTNFLSSTGWSQAQIELLIENWNKKNPDPLREVIIKGHLNHHFKTQGTILPPNCDNQPYYKDLGICMPDSLCKRIKNPANYAHLRIRMKREVNQKENKNNLGLVETN